MPDGSQHQRQATARRLAATTRFVESLSREPVNVSAGGPVFDRGAAAGTAVWHVEVTGDFSLGSGLYPGRLLIPYTDTSPVGWPEPPEGEPGAQPEDDPRTIWVQPLPGEALCVGARGLARLAGKYADGDDVRAVYALGCGCRCPGDEPSGGSGSGDSGPGGGGSGGSGSSGGSGGSGGLTGPTATLQTDVECVDGVLYRTQWVQVGGANLGETREAIGCCSCGDGSGGGSGGSGSGGSGGSGSGTPEPPVTDCHGCPDGAPHGWTFDPAATGQWANLAGPQVLLHEAACKWVTGAGRSRWVLNKNSDGSWTLHGECVLANGLLGWVVFQAASFDCCGPVGFEFVSQVGPAWTGPATITIAGSGLCGGPEPPLGDCDYQYPAVLYGTWNGFTGDCTQFVGSFALPWNGTAWVGTDPSSGATVTVTPADFGGGTATWPVDITGGGCGYSYTAGDVTCGLLPAVSSITVTGCCTGVTQLILSE